MKYPYSLFYLWGFSREFSPELYPAEVYEFGSNRQNLLFLHYNEIVDQESVKIIKHFYAFPDSTITVFDEGVLKNGKFRASRSQLDQIQETAALRCEGDELRVEIEGKMGFKEKTVDYKQDLIAGPIFSQFVRENWKVLLEGENVHFHLPASNMLRLVRFKIKRHDNSEYKREGVIVLKMKPSCFLLRSFVDASYIVHNLTSRRVEEIHGFTILPTQKENGEWQNTHVNMYFNY